jgi:NurA-like 5'-3' nuclease
MFDFLLEKISQRKAAITSKIGGIRFDETAARDMWMPRSIPEGEKLVLAGSDGSYNSKSFRSFTIYAVDAEVLIYDGTLRAVKSCDVDILYPYKFQEERLRFYMHMFETKTLANVLDNNKIDLALFDGSIMGDIIRPLPFQLNPGVEVRNKLKEVYLPRLESDKIEIISKGLFGEIEKAFPDSKIEAQSYLEYLEHLRSLHNLLRHKDKIVAISKTSTASDYFNSGLPDIAIFDRLEGEGYSKPIYVPVNERLKREFPILDDFFRDLTFTVFYARMKDRKNMLKFELPRKVDEKEIESIISSIKNINVEGYPYILRKAHRDVIIRNADMERIVRMFGFIEKTGREMLK